MSTTLHLIREASPAPVLPGLERLIEAPGEAGRDAEKLIWSRKPRGVRFSSKVAHRKVGVMVSVYVWGNVPVPVGRARAAAPQWVFARAWFAKGTDPGVIRQWLDTQKALLQFIYNAPISEYP